MSDFNQAARYLIRRVPDGFFAGWGRRSVQRLLGDPNKRGEVRAEVSLTSFLAHLRDRPA